MFFLTDPDPLQRAPSHLSKNDKLWWARVYETSMDTWVGPLRGFHERDAKLTADLASRTFRQGCRGMSKFPNPGDLAELGVVTSVDWVDRDAVIWSETWGKTDRNVLMWSRLQKALYIVPGLKPGACHMPPVFEDHQVLLTWTQGRRGGRCSAALPPLPRVSLPHCAPCIAVSYTSDKFDDRGKTTDYIHHIDSPGVRVYMDRTYNPRVLVIKGGKLRVEKHGIAG